MCYITDSFDDIGVRMDSSIVQPLLGDLKGVSPQWSAILTSLPIDKHLTINEARSVQLAGMPGVVPMVQTGTPQGQLGAARVYAQLYSCSDSTVQQVI